MNLIIIKGLLLIFASIGNIPVNGQIPKPEVADRISIVYFKGVKPLTYSTTNYQHVKFFEGLIRLKSGNMELPCDTTGEILYLKGNKQLLRIYFSTKITGSIFRSPATVYSANNQIIRSGLSYNTGMLIDEMFYRLNK